MTNEMDMRPMENDMGQARYWMTEAPVFRAIAHMAVPMILGMVAMSVYSFTDTLFVGMLGSTDALAALPLSMPVMSLMLAVSMLFEVGAGTFVSRAIGSSDERASRSGSSFAVVGSAIAGIVLAALLALLMDPVLALLGATGSLAVTAKSYLSAYCLGAPFVVLNMVEAQLVRSIAKSKEASFGIAGSAIANIVLDPILMFGFGLGIEGAALATVISNALGAVYFAAIIARSKVLSLRPADIHLSRQQFAEIVKVGSSAMLMGLFMGVASLVFNNVAVAYGAGLVAAFGIAQSVVALLDFVTMGLYEGVVPLIGGAWGARDTSRMREVIKKTALCLAVFCCVACVAAVAFSGPIVSWFSDDPSVLDFGPAILAMQVLAVPFAAGSGLMMGVLQACGKGLAANTLSMVKGLAFVPCVLAGSLLFAADGVIASLFVAELLSFCLAAALCACAFGKRGNVAVVAA